MSTLTFLTMNNNIILNTQYNSLYNCGLGKMLLESRDLEAEVAIPLLAYKESSFCEGSTNAHCQY